MRYLTVEEVVLIHERILDRPDRSPGVRHWHLLDSAVQRSQATFGGDDLYPDLFHKAAVLGQSLVLNHPFVDGNKRTAWEAMHTMVEENRYSLSAEADEIVSFVLQIERKDLDDEAIAAWLEGHAEALED
ncbi:MAG: type II toxin-antitoxin system death-on-curing family toxin [Salinibacter sp.]